MRRAGSLAVREAKSSPITAPSPLTSFLRIVDVLPKRFFELDSAHAYAVVLSDRAYFCPFRAPFIETPSKNGKSLPRTLFCKVPFKNTSENPSCKLLQEPSDPPQACNHLDVTHSGKRILAWPLTAPQITLGLGSCPMQW